MGLITHNLQQLNNNTKTELYLLKNQLGEIKNPETVEITNLRNEIAMLKQVVEQKSSEN